MLVEITDNVSYNDRSSTTDLHKTCYIRHDRSSTTETVVSAVGARIEAPKTMQTISIQSQESAEAELMIIHHKFGHISTRKLQKMDSIGILPKGLTKCPIPKCTACLYGKASKSPWRHRNSNNKSRTDMHYLPGTVVAIDKMISPTPGYIAQMSGTPTVQ